MPAPVDISDPFRALSDPTRREMVALLAAGPLPVRLIAARFPSISRPAVSKHLRVLREGNLVSEERSGRERFYRLEFETVESVLGWVVEVRAGTGAPPQERPTRASRKTTSRPKRKKPKRPKRSKERRPEPVQAPAEEPGDWKSW